MDDPFAMSRTQSTGNLNRQTEQISTDNPPGVDGRSSPRFVASLDRKRLGQEPSR
jgi:hypothetical protein